MLTTVEALNMQSTVNNDAVQKENCKQWHFYYHNSRSQELVYYELWNNKGLATLNIIIL